MLDVSGEANFGTGLDGCGAAAVAEDVKGIVFLKSDLAKSRLSDFCFLMLRVFSGVTEALLFMVNSFLPLYLNLDPKLRVKNFLVVAVVVDGFLTPELGGACSLKKEWCSTADFHRFLHDLQN